MESSEEIDSRGTRREAVLASLVFVDATAVERRFRRFLEAHGGAINEWDQRFLEFIALHRDERLLAGSAGGGFDFAFSVRDSAGFWVLETREGAGGKGFLTHHDAERILELARVKGLLG